MDIFVSYTKLDTNQYFMKAYSQDLRDRVISYHTEQQMSTAAISSLFKISIQTVRDWIKKYETTGDYSSKQGANGGRPCKFSDKTKLLDCLGIHTDANAIEIRDIVAPGLHMNTFYGSLKRMKVTYKKRAKIQTKERLLPPGIHESDKSI